ALLPQPRGPAHRGTGSLGQRGPLACRRCAAPPGLALVRAGGSIRGGTPVARRPRRAARRRHRGRPFRKGVGTAVGEPAAHLGGGAAVAARGRRRGRGGRGPRPLAGAAGADPAGGAGAVAGGAVRVVAARGVWGPRRRSATAGTWKAPLVGRTRRSRPPGWKGCRRRAGRWA